MPSGLEDLCGSTNVVDWRRTRLWQGGLIFVWVGRRRLGCAGAVSVVTVVVVRNPRDGQREAEFFVMAFVCQFISEKMEMIGRVV